MMVTVSDLGEYALIERVENFIQLRQLEHRPEIKLIAGIGDDAAAWQVSGIQVTTTDSMVEDVHFRRSTFSYFDIGWKSWVTNLSDVIAMGGTPLAGLVTLGIPEDMLLEDFDSLYDGILSACKEYQTVVLGGDIVASRVLFVSVAMIGSCEKTPILRSGAQIGDVIAVSGSLGDALGGLQLLEQGSAINTEASRRLIEKQRRPKVNVDFAQLSKILGIHAMMDLSDGLLIDLAKLAHSSGVATQIQASLVPISDDLQKEFPLKAEEMALNGGEDYELLLVGAENTLQDFVNRHPKAAIIGKVIEGERGNVTVFDASGFEMELSDLNWEHFK